MEEVELASIPKTPLITNEEIVSLSKVISDDIMEAILENINKAFDLMHEGKSIRSVINF